MKKSGPRVAINSSQTAGKDCNWFVFEYKCKPCPKQNQCRNKVLCPGYHRDKERRRDPKIYKYDTMPCPNVRSMARGWGLPSQCPNGDECVHTHTLLETMHHPLLYKKNLCTNFIEGNQCEWGVYCSHAHGIEDQNVDGTWFLADPSNPKCRDYVTRKLDNIDSATKLRQKINTGKVKTVQIKTTKTSQNVWGRKSPSPTKPIAPSTSIFSIHDPPLITDTGKAFPSLQSINTQPIGTFGNTSYQNRSSQLLDQPIRRTSTPGLLSQPIRHIPTPVTAPNIEWLNISPQTKWTDPIFICRNCNSAKREWCIVPCGHVLCASCQLKSTCGICATVKQRSQKIQW